MMTISIYLFVGLVFSAFGLGVVARHLMNHEACLPDVLEPLHANFSRLPKEGNEFPVFCRGETYAATCNYNSESTLIIGIKRSVNRE